MSNAPAPLPYDCLAISTGAGSGGFHLYLIDANGRKIAAIWGPSAEKEETAKFIVAACNSALLNPEAE